MSIQFNPQALPPLPVETGGPRAASASKPVAAESASASGFGGDETHLSAAAVLAAASSTLPEVRADKVAAVQQALANGSYAVSPSDVAGKLIDHLLQS